MVLVVHLVDAAVQPWNSDKEHTHTQTEFMLACTVMENYKTVTRMGPTSTPTAVTETTTTSTAGHSNNFSHKEQLMFLMMTSKNIG